MMKERSTYFQWLMFLQSTVFQLEPKCRKCFKRCLQVVSKIHEFNQADGGGNKILKYF